MIGLAQDATFRLPAIGRSYAVGDIFLYLQQHEMEWGKTGGMRKIADLIGLWSFLKLMAS